MLLTPATWSSTEMRSIQSRAVEGHGMDASTPFRYVVGYECPRCGAVRHEFPIQSCTRSPTAWLFRVPELNVTAICKARSIDARILRSTTGQSVDECVRAEEAAKQQLSTLWEKTSVVIRSRCESDARSLGTTSYLDLLTCIQMAEDEKSNPKKPAGR